MFAKWLDTQENAIWDQLLEALRSPSVQLMHLAKQIEQMLDHEQNNNHGKEIMIRCHVKITGIDAKSIYSQCILPVFNGAYVFKILYIASYIAMRVHNYLMIIAITLFIIHECRIVTKSSSPS